MKIKTMDHVSFTASDLDAMEAFYGRFGYETCRKSKFAGPAVDAGVDAERADSENRWMRSPWGGPMIEFVHYIHYPHGRSAHNSQVGAAHVCFEVDDIAEAYAELVAAGVEFLTPPNDDGEGDLWCYARDPDGNAVELIQHTG